MERSQIESLDFALFVVFYISGNVWGGGYFVAKTERIFHAQQILLIFFFFLNSHLKKKRKKEIGTSYLESAPCLSETVFFF